MIVNVFYCPECVVSTEAAVERNIYCLCSKEMVVIGAIETAVPKKPSTGKNK